MPEKIPSYTQVITKMAKINTLFLTKMAENPYPLRSHLYKEVPLDAFLCIYMYTYKWGTMYRATRQSQSPNEYLVLSKLLSLRGKHKLVCCCNSRVQVFIHSIVKFG